MTSQGALDAIAKVCRFCLSQLVEAVRNDENMKAEDWITKEIFNNEALKTGFNLTLSTSPLSTSMFSPEKAIVELDGNDPDTIKYHQYLSAVVRVCVMTKLKTPAMSGLHQHGINTMMNLPCINPDIWFPKDDYSILNVLLDIFDESFRALSIPNDDHSIDEENIYGTTMDQALIPLCILLKKLTIIPEARERIKKRIMPVDIDRTKHLNEGKSLTAALIRSMTSIRLNQTKDFMCELMVACCEGNGTIFRSI